MHDKFEPAEILSPAFIDFFRSQRAALFVVNPGFHEGGSVPIYGNHSDIDVVE